MSETTPDNEATPTGFQVRLANFEGPFDLLLQLIFAHRLDVTEVALHQVTGEAEFRDSKLKKALDDLEKLEDEFLATVKKAAGGAGAPFKSQWGGVLSEQMSAGTATALSLVEADRERAEKDQRHWTQKAV